MSDDGNQRRERDLRDRIVHLMRANQQARKNPVTAEELKKLQSASMRLDRMLQTTQNANQQVLKTAASRLDQLLADIRKGKDVTASLKRRQGSPKKD